MRLRDTRRQPGESMRKWTSRIEAFIKKTGKALHQADGEIDEATFLHPLIQGNSVAGEDTELEDLFGSLEAAEACAVTEFKNASSGDEKLHMKIHGGQGSGLSSKACKR